MLIGYARVRTEDQDLLSQTDELEQAGCDKVFSDVASGRNVPWPGLDLALSHARKGDILVVTRLVRLGRSLRHLIETVGQLDAQGIGLRSLKESIDTTIGSGRLVLDVFRALAEFERDLIRERTNAALATARARGRLGGRKRKLDDKKKARALALHNDPNIPIMEICDTLKISKATLYRYLNEATPRKTGRRPAVLGKP